MDDSVYFFTAYNTLGDYYYGYAYADTGTYDVGQYLYSSTYDNDGGQWYYHIYAVYDFDYDTGFEGYSIPSASYYYYDNDTGYGASDFTGFFGFEGIGSELGSLNSNGEQFGHYGYYEADNDPAPADSLYYFIAVNSNGDYYYGYSYADTEYYQPGQYIFSTVLDNDGGYWYYYIYDTFEYGYDTGFQGTSYVNPYFSYYDNDAGAGAATYNSYTGHYGIGSEYGYLTSSGEYFGQFGYFEADTNSSSETIYYFLAVNTNGDYYYGFHYGEDESHYVGEYIFSSVYDNDGGFWYYYVYAEEDAGYNTGNQGRSFINTLLPYYDADTDTSIDVTYSSFTGYGGIGSEYGYLPSGGEYFGQFGYFEADNYVSPSDSVYFYLALNSNGDYYYGYSYADTGTYQIGNMVEASSYDNDGGLWSYYIYLAYDFGYDTGLQYYSYVNSDIPYYDVDTGYGATDYHSFIGYGGPGSEYGYLDTSEEYFGLVDGYGYFEADN